MYIAEHLVFQHKKEFQSEYFEHLWVDIKLKNKTFAINALYRPPNESAADHQIFLQTAENILLQLNNYDKAEYKIIASDLNFGNCFCKNPILDPKPLDSTAPDLFESFGFKQLIDIPTRITLNTISLIDLIFTNKIDDIICHGTLPKIADHEGVIVSLNTKSKKIKQNSRIIYDYQNADEDGLRNYIEANDFENTVFNLPIPNQTEMFTQILQDAFAKFVPSKTVHIRNMDQPWCNNFTRLLLRKKNRNYQFFKKCELEYQKTLKQSNPAPELITCLMNRKNKAHDKARSSANDSFKANRRAKSAYFDSVNNILKNPSISAKRKFSILFKLMKNSKYCSVPPLIENNETIQDSLQQSNIFNNFFASKSTVRNGDDPVPILNRKDGISSLKMANTSPIEVAKIIRNIKKSYLSHCGIPGKFIHLISTPILFSMSRFFNNLFGIPGKFIHLIIS